MYNLTKMNANSVVVFMHNLIHATVTSVNLDLMSHNVCLCFLCAEGPLPTFIQELLCHCA